MTARLIFRIIPTCRSDDKGRALLTVNTMRKTRIPLVFLLIFLANPFTTAQQSGWSGYRTPIPSQPISSPLPIGEPQSNGETDYLLLKTTGFLMEGVATNEGKNYTVKTEFGSLQVPVANVEFIGKSRQDVYQFRRNLVDGNNCQDLMKFAEWCTNNGLVKEAVEEYVRARRIVPNTALDSVILQRIESLQRQAATPIPFAAPDAGLSKVGAADSDGDDIGRWVNGMPKSIVDSFSRKVQPILASRCAASDCHGSASDNGFKIGIPRHPNGSTTYRNLQASLQWIDPANPSASPLLAAMVSYHGGAKPPFNVESNQYTGTIQWIQATIKELPTEYADRLYTTKQLKKVETATTPIPKQQEVPQTFFTETNPPTRENISTVLPPSSVPVPVDPFDPTPFNARFHGTVRR